MKARSKYLFVLQELQQAIADKAAAVKAHKQTGDNLKKLVSEDEAPKVETVSDEVDEKWRSLCSDVEDLTKSMFSTKERVDAFQNGLEDIEKWLKETEETIAALEPVAVEPEKVKEQLANQTVTC